MIAHVLYKISSPCATKVHAYKYVCVYNWSIERINKYKNTKKKCYARGFYYMQEYVCAASAPQQQAN